MGEPQKLARIGQDRTETCQRPAPVSPGWLTTPSNVDKSRAWYLERGPPLMVILLPFRPEANLVKRSQIVSHSIKGVSPSISGNLRKVGEKTILSQ